MNKFHTSDECLTDVYKNVNGKCLENPASYLKTEKQREAIRSLIDVKDGLLYTMEYTVDYMLDGILEANIPNIDSLVEFANNNMLVDGKIKAAPTNYGCSAFTATTKDSAVLYGRNFDYKMNMSSVLIRTKPKTGYASIGLVDTGWIGYGAGSLDDGVTDLSSAVLFPYLIMDGMNEKGLAISVLKLDGEPTRQNRGKKMIVTTVALRLLLDRAATVEEAVSLLDSYDMQSALPNGSFHFLLADATGKSVVIEYCNNEISILNDYYATNFYLAADMDSYGHGKDRYEVMEATLHFKSNVLSEKEAMALLQLVSQEETEESTSMTQWSVVYNLSDLTGIVSVLRDYENLFHFSFEE